ncbi:hypothetical protein [Sinorhizobium sp. BJ1]|uniref:hypothetical protein n=1 Tax=Sinorhizobium sp. BJ1 TaxID=2035455 RepID=UPI000BE83EB8|nr:hypothetical protein [Sinorhizobium sp. BJ1]PDT81811.1 hypothetical protein CO676_19770 [Sinorhizobium sp. BJ1]
MSTPGIRFSLSAIYAGAEDPLARRWHPRRILEGPIDLNTSKKEDKPDALVTMFDAEFFHLDVLPEPRLLSSDEEEWRPNDYWIPDPEELEPED